MSQKLLQGGTEPPRRATRIREVFAEQFGGSATIEQLREACIKEGIFEDAVDQALRAFADRECKKVLKEPDAAGLNYAAAVQKNEAGQPVWMQRSFWGIAEYRVHVGELRRHRGEVDEKIGKFVKECKDRYGQSV